MRAWRSLITVLVLVALSGCGPAEPDGPRKVLSRQQHWSSVTVPAGLRIAVIDGGIDRDHPALRGVVVDTWRASGLPAESSAHATQLAGIIAGRPNEAYGGGLASGVSVLDAKALDSAGVGRPSDVAEALRWSEEAGAEIVLTSLAMEADDPGVRDAVARLVRRDAVVVSASGNAFSDAPVYPASYPGVLSVSAHDRDGERLQLAGWNFADVVAPGDRVWSPTPPATYEAISGTSVAAAVTAGLLAGCGSDQPRSEADILGRWTNGTVTYGGRALPRLICPGHHEQGEN